MSEYIKKKDLLKEVAKIGGNPWSEWETAGVFLLINRQATYTLDDLRPKGRWLPQPEDWREQMEGHRCSLCGFEYFGSRFDFCPHCGAKMDLEV